MRMKKEYEKSEWEEKKNKNYLIYQPLAYSNYPMFLTKDYT